MFNEMLDGFFKKKKKSVLNGGQSRRSEKRFSSNVIIQISPQRITDINVNFRDEYVE